MRIALLEDDESTADIVQHWLEEKSNVCHIYRDGPALLNALTQDSYDLLILDWELPTTTGIEVTKNIREKYGYNTPILFTTGRNSEEDIVTALESGADDYLIKPVRKAELFARVKALIRRFTQSVNNHAIIKYDPYSLDANTFTVSHGNQAVTLTAKEFELAEFLFRNQGRILSRGHILESVWGQRSDLNTRTVDTHISLLRKKLMINPENGWRLNTIYRHGYRLEKLSMIPSEAI